MATLGVYPRPKKLPKERVATERMQACRVRNQKEANFQNMAIQHELRHTLKTYDNMKLKAVQGLDFEQRKFLQQASSRSSEYLPTTMSEHATSTTTATNPKLRPASSHGNLHDPQRRPHNASIDKLKQELKRSNSDLDVRVQRASDDEEEEGVGDEEGAGEYSINSNMRIAQARGTFEASTGKDGLQAWMGKSSPKFKKSTKFKL